MTAFFAAGTNLSLYASTERFQPYCQEHALSFAPVQAPYGLEVVNPVLSVLLIGQVVICELTSPGFAVFTYSWTFGCLDPVRALLAQTSWSAIHGFVLAAVPPFTPTIPK
jgi:hypothetical protein